MSTNFTDSRLKCLSLSMTPSSYFERLKTALEKKQLTWEDRPHLRDGCYLLFFDDPILLPKVLSRLEEISELNSKTLIVYHASQPLPHFEVMSLIEAGASDIFLDMELIELQETILAFLRRQKIIQRMMASDRVKNRIIGNCGVWTKTLEQAVEIACFSQSTVLIGGESGTGKELIARLIHDLDRRPDKEKLVLLDCTTIVKDLSGSEFFGHEKGAFTNAISKRDGAFALANGGTLFLDEIGELPLSLQAELLRVIQEGTYKRLGSNQWQTTNFRLLCATNRNLEQEVEKGNFRQDLYYRIAACVLELPPLRSRKDDILLLTQHFLKDALSVPSAPKLDKYVLNYLLTHSFPGNVRELKQLAQRLISSYTGTGKITPGVFFKGIKTVVSSAQKDICGSIEDAVRMYVANGLGLKEIKKIAGNIAMDISIENHQGNLQLAAQELQVSDRTLQQYQAGKSIEEKAVS